MRIDFHCHTKAVKNGEKETRNITVTDFKKAVKNANVRMVAITNHNIFDKIQYDEFKVEVNDEFILLPGIELDVIGEHKERGHVVIVYDDKDLDAFTTKINNILGTSTPVTYTINIDDLIDFLNSLNCVVLAHYYKPDSLSLDSINKIRDSINDNFRFFYEPSNYRTLGIMINHQFRALKGTDIQDWNDYGKQEFATVKLNIDSYKQLLLFLKKDDTVIESLLNKQAKHSINVAYKDGEKEEIEFYDDINVFFGTKGTGKTVSLDKIKQYFLSKGKSVSDYSPNESKDKLDKKLEITESEKKLKTYNLENCELEFKYISEWMDLAVTQFTDYYNYVKYKDSNENKKRMKIVDISKLLGYETSVLTKEKNNYDNIVSAKQLLGNIQMENYITDEKIKTLNDIINELQQAIMIGYENAYQDKLATKLTNKAIQDIKNVVEKKTETKTMPSTTGFTEFVKNRFILDLKINKILSGFKFQTETEPEFVGILEEGKILEKKTFVTMLNKESKSNENGFTGIMELKLFKSKLEDIDVNCYTNAIGTPVSEFSAIYKNFPSLSLDSFVGIIKKFVLDNKEYKPSSGESTMIVLDEALNEKYDIYILDEPEKSLGNNYISDVLVTKINDLAKMKKTIIIATHNANVAVRTLPYRSILKAYYNGEYKTYIGNPYTNKLVNIKDISDIKDWKEESIKILEGGKEAFEERSDIYA